MSRVLFIMLMTILLSGAVLADTLYLRNGTVLEGIFLGFEDGQFSFQVTSGSDRDRGRVLRFPAREVDRLVIERANTGPQPPGPARGSFEFFPAFDVGLVDQWVKSDIQVSRGQRVRVEASGQIYLDGRIPSSPDGINRRDPNAPLPNDPDGALVAAIGTDPNSPAILIGSSREFTANRDGVLYFTVNHWDTTNARGAYRARVAVERRSSVGGGGGTFVCGLGNQWNETESGYSGVWTRIRETNTFDAVWTRDGEQITGTLTITTQGNRVFVRRTASSDGYLCEYEGTVGADGVTVSGTYRCPGNQRTLSWQATINCQGRR